MIIKNTKKIFLKKRVNKFFFFFLFLTFQPKASTLLLKMENKLIPAIIFWARRTCMF